MGGVSQSGCLDLFRGDLWQAYEYFTGSTLNQANPHCIQLRDALEKQNISGYEYLYWVIHFAFGTSCRYGELIKVSAWTCPAWKERFLLYRKGREAETKKMVRLQYDEAVSLIQLLGAGVLLETQHGLGALIRVEMALRQKEDAGYDPVVVLTKFGKQAGQVLRGCPEVLLYTPAICAALETDDAVYRCL